MKKNLHHAEIDAFLDDLWEFPLIEEQQWNTWEKNHPSLVHNGLGDPLPSGFQVFLTSQGVDQEEFQRLIANVVEVVFSSFYGAADDASSWDYLKAVLKIADQTGISPPPLGVFLTSRFADRFGWGRKITPAERKEWRALEY